MPLIVRMSQETLAEMVGTTRSRVSFFLNRFREMGFIEYGSGGMHVRFADQRRASRLGTDFVYPRSGRPSRARGALRCTLLRRHL